MNAMTLMQKYYAINSALNSYLISHGISCPVIKYGVDPATLVDETGPSPFSAYPYIQTYISNVTQQPWTSKEAGLFTTFDFQLSFFTAPDDEFINDADFFIPFEAAKLAFTDINARALQITDESGNSVMIADILSLRHHYEFDLVSGSPVPAAFLIAKMRTVCSYAIETPDATDATNIDEAITITPEN